MSIKQTHADLNENVTLRSKVEEERASGKLASRRVAVLDLASAKSINIIQSESESRPATPNLNHDVSFIISPTTPRNTTQRHLNETSSTPVTPINPYRPILFSPSNFFTPTQKPRNERDLYAIFFSKLESNQVQLLRDRQSWSPSPSSSRFSSRI
ncbi:hypothetical protein CROQUDRAFT_673820 [Cronartium quercuum f. sp. fusiforme G11]|uniref:Uncharacterized protein n=1 Tax=Cronartium quercuum f. sp. fusiforme G11 TaxID=708437 RepID=A0A9P6ND41_9BASI|nr:hypothetical protein CROQUDRAFT_673820 [Cronartium quercuum f. sp. fusiforme G11]